MFGILGGVSGGLVVGLSLEEALLQVLPWTVLTTMLLSRIAHWICSSCIPERTTQEEISVEFGEKRHVAVATSDNGKPSNNGNPGRGFGTRKDKSEEHIRTVHRDIPEHLRSEA